MRRRPVPPENVRLVRANGDVVPLELRYTGHKGGIHHWVAVMVLEPRDGDRVRVDVLPGKTAVGVLFELPE